LREAGPLEEACRKVGLAPVFLLPPGASNATFEQVSARSRGYTYVLSRAGVTGAETSGQPALSHVVKHLKSLGAAPAVLGFGISSAEQVALATAAGFQGVIVGSALVSKLSQNQDISAYLKELKTATRRFVV